MREKFVGWRPLSWLTLLGASDDKMSKMPSLPPNLQPSTPVCQVCSGVWRRVAMALASANCPVYLSNYQTTLPSSPHKPHKQIEKLFCCQAVGPSNVPCGHPTYPPQAEKISREFLLMSVWGRPRNRITGNSSGNKTANRQKGPTEGCNC